MSEVFQEIKGIKFRLYPTKSQESLFYQFTGNNRFLWNSMLAKNIRRYKQRKKFIFYHDMAKRLQPLKEEYDFLKLSPSQSLQGVCRDLEKALKACFKSGFGFPKFKKRGFGDSFRIPQASHLKISKSKKSIYLPKIGYVKWKKHLPIRFKNIHYVTVIKDGNHWYISLCYHFYPKDLPKTGKQVGLDLGTVRLATTNKGKVIEKFKDKELDRKIKSTQRKLERRTLRFKNGKMKKEQSKSHTKAKYTLTKLQKKKRDKRKDYLHKTSKRVINKYDIICVEDLKIKNMTKQVKKTEDGSPRKGVSAKAGLNREILNQGWGEFLNMLEYKSKWYDRVVIRVNPKKTSQRCSHCGFTSKGNRLSQSRFVCKKCGLEINADKNAAKNILKLGLDQFKDYKKAA